jgi:hypothetical protein
MFTCLNTATQDNSVVLSSADDILDSKSQLKDANVENKLIMNGVTYAKFFEAAKKSKSCEFNLKESDQDTRAPRAGVVYLPGKKKAHISVVNTCPSNLMYLLPAEAQEVGCIPIRQDMTVIPFDRPEALQYGWVFYEEIGMFIRHDKPIKRFEIE